MEAAGEPASAAVVPQQPAPPPPEDDLGAPLAAADEPSPERAPLDDPPPMEQPPPPMEPPPEEPLPPPPTVVAVQSPPLPPPEKSEKHRYHEEEQEGEWQCAHWFEYVLVVALAALLLLAALVLTLFWAIYYREGFAWSENHVRQFNLHPVLMVAGFVTFSGFSVLLYRVCRCCRRLHVKLFHTIFHALAIPCVVVGFWAALDWHNLQQPPLPNFHTLHSWMGLVTMGLFALQFVVGFFSFLILLCCEGATAAFRASLVPIHASFGITTFMLAIATCLTGLTQKSYEHFGSSFYTSSWSEEGIIINALAMVLVALGILVSYTVRRDGSRGEGKTFLSERL